MISSGMMTESSILSGRSKRTNVRSILLLNIDSDEQIREMQKSIRNISTNKKSTKFRKLQKPRRQPEQESEDEQLNYMTESQDTHRNRHHRSETVAAWQDSRFGN